MKNAAIKILKKVGLYSFIKRFQLFAQADSRKTMSLYRPLISRGDLCFDIGANMGARTEIFLALGAKVIAVEPQSRCAHYIQSHFVDGFSNPQTTVVQKALSDREGIAKISLSKDTTVVATMSEAWRTKGRFAGEFSWDSYETVQTTTLDTLIKTYGTPSFCKIDVEGYEEEVIRGLTQIIPHISFEFTSEFLDVAERILVRLATLGTVTCNYSIGESHSLALEKWVTPSEVISSIKKESIPNIWGDLYVSTTRQK